MVFIHTFDSAKPLEAQVELPFCFHKEEGIFVDRSKGDYYLVGNEGNVRTTPSSAAYGAAFGKDGYVAVGEFLRYLHPDARSSDAVRTRIKAFRKEIKELTQKELIYTRHLVSPHLPNDRHKYWLEGGYYIKDLSALRNEKENLVSWNGFRLNQLTGYLRLPDETGHALSFSQMLIIEKSIQGGQEGAGMDELQGHLVDGNEHYLSPQNLAKKIQLIRGIIGSEFIATIKDFGYCLVNTKSIS